MNPEILFSILVPSIPSRFEMVKRLVDGLEQQIGDLPVEILCLLDNKRRTIGMKRDALVQLARGSFLAFVDDDDFAFPGYVSEIVSAIREHPDVDVIVFNQHASINGSKFTVRFGLEYENQQAGIGPDGFYGDVTRKPFHICPWRRELAQKYRFENCNYGEDWFWVEQLIKEAKTQHRIEKVLHTYIFSDAVTEAKDENKPVEIKDEIQA